MKRTRINILSAVVIPQDFEGMMVVKDITPEEARMIISNVSQNNIRSYIGHRATAKVMSKLLEHDIASRRAMLKNLSEEDIIIAFSLNKRIEEGRVIETVEELEEIGYSLKIMIPYLSIQSLLCL